MRQTFIEKKKNFDEIEQKFPKKIEKKIGLNIHHAKSGVNSIFSGDGGGGEDGGEGLGEGGGLGSKK